MRSGLFSSILSWLLSQCATTGPSTVTLKQDVATLEDASLLCDSGDFVILDGDLSLSGGEQADLEALSCLIEVTGSVSITEGGWTSMAGLDNLTTIGDTLSIGGNASLETLSGLEALILSDENHLYIWENSALTQLTGPTVSGGLRWLSLSENPALISLDGLEGLEALGYLSIEWNESLEDIDALRDLRSVGGCEYDCRALIQHNAALADLDGLESLEDVEMMIISQNDQLTDASGLAQLEKAEFLGIEGTAITGLSLPDLELAGGMYIADNPSLITISMPRLAEITPVPDSFLDVAGPLGMFSMVGLESISGDDIHSDYLNGGLFINKNTQLTELDFGALSFFDTGTLYIKGNARLESLEGFEGITALTRLTIDNNHTLIDLAGFSNLETVTSWVFINGNNALSGLSGLDALSYAGGLYLNNNDSLLSLEGLYSLEHVSDELVGLKISKNDGLTSLEGLETLRTVDGTLYIQNNAELSDLSILENLDEIGSLNVQDSAQLCDSAVEELAELLGITFVSHDNGDC